MLAVLGLRAVAPAVQLDALDPAAEWRLADLDFRGPRALSAATLRDAMVTQARPWYQAWRFWRPDPPFDPIAFREDLERIRRLYRNHGYYETAVHHDIELPADGNAVRAVVYVEEGPPVHVASIEIRYQGVPVPPPEAARIRAGLPLDDGDVFAQPEYAAGEAYLRTWFRDRGFARVTVDRRAEVDVGARTAVVSYAVDTGLPSVFGDVRVVGTETVDPAVVRRELAFRPGQPFRQQLLDETRDRLVALRLFRSIRIQEDPGTDPRVGVRVRVVEGPSREVRLGLGYDTEEGVRGLATWRDYDFFGGARQLGFTARASLLRRTFVADFLQPHVPTRTARTRLVASHDQEDEETYTNDRSRLSPRLEWQVRPWLAAYAFYRIEYDSLSDVNEIVRRAFPAIAPDHGILSGLGFGADLHATDDVVDPTRGWVASTSVEPVGGVLGGDFSFVRMIGEVRRYQPLVGRLGLALRGRLGAAEPTGDDEDVPLFERLYAGGINSVRGYERRHVGPLIGDDPLGGRSLIEGSVELRHPVTERIGAAVFLDAGRVSAASFDWAPDDLRYGAGVGVRYRTPVGPLRLDLGFPFDPPADDAAWQVHVSIGQVF